uniref:PLAC domain-containing protein n=1 Tax=Glossina pallidipes TaxID=7398 RepID=A0A1A9ZFE6_GLOPL
MLVDKGLEYGIDFDQQLHQYNTQEDEPDKSVSQYVTKNVISNSSPTLSYTDIDADKTNTAVEKNTSMNVNVNDENGLKEDLQTTIATTTTLHLPHARWPNHWSDTTSKANVAHAVTYRWQMSSWSECSQKCGAAGMGLRRRGVTCIRVHFLKDPTQPEPANHYTEHEVVDNSLCIGYGLSIPDTFETCTTDSECPRWIKGEWTMCQRSRCFGPNTAIQKREVSCRYANDTITSNCSEYEKPISRQECYNERCKGVWRVEPWSECNAPCGRQGIKYRILQCVWYGTRRPAGNACKHQPRPAVMKVCRSPPCYAKTLQQCKDTSRYCRNVRSMGLCRLYRYQEKCCKSCRYHSNAN